MNNIENVPIMTAMFQLQTTDNVDEQRTDQQYARNTHKCIKDLSPLKANGDMDLIWLFSMKLEENQQQSQLDAQCKRFQSLYMRQC